jgi:anti-repressor protein
MRGLLLVYTEKVLALEAKVEANKPKAEFYDNYLNADGLYGLQNAARALKCRPNLFIRWLKENYLFYQGGNLVARIQQIQLGNFEVKTTLVDDKVRPQALVTPKGLKY